MYSHLFETDDYTTVFATENDILVAFATFDYLSDICTLYLNGIIVHRDFQGHQISKQMIATAIRHHDTPEFLVARTHNPRMFETLAAFAFSDQRFYPNQQGEIPSYIWDIVKKCPLIVNADSRLIIKNAYPDEKTSQTTRNYCGANAIFQELEERDACAIVAHVR